MLLQRIVKLNNRNTSEAFANAALHKNSKNYGDVNSENSDRCPNFDQCASANVHTHRKKENLCFFAVTFVNQDTNVQPRTLSVGNAEKGHYSKVCRSALYSGTSAAVELASITGFENNIISATSPSTLSKVITKVLLNGKIINALIDTGSTESFIRDDLVKELELKRHPRHGRVSMAATTLSTCTPITGACMVDFTLLGRKYNDVYLSILPLLVQRYYNWS